MRAGVRCRYSLAATASAGVLLLAACGHGQNRAAAVAQPVVLAQLALSPADLDDQYDVQSDRYLDSDGNTAPVATQEFIRQLQIKEPAAGEAPVASRILISLSDLGTDGATEFMDAAGDASVGPPNLEDYIQKQIAGSGNVHDDLLDDFPSTGDDSVANRLSWDSETEGQPVTWYSYAVYIRDGGLLGLVAARAEDSGHGEPDGLRKEAESLVKKQADKMRGSRVLAPAPGARRYTKRTDTMIDVTLMPLLAKRATSRRERLSLDFRSGLTPSAIAESEGFHGLDLEPLLAIVNGTQAEMDTALADGDAVELRIGIAGG